ncbi:MAG: hypothetical protein OEV00_06360 [Acidobacteriota bacterium]|nr:hypothetical protein [Acidobacteriota bacterium]MDH3784933.1 hypothetical protein [Acidobacteriota bacterium]
MSGLEQEFKGKVVAKNMDATTPESATICKELGFSNHGLVVRDGAGDVLWSQPDHEVVVDDARQAIKGLLDKV